MNCPPGGFLFRSQAFGCAARVLAAAVFCAGHGLVVAADGVFAGFSEPIRTVELSCPEAGVVAEITVEEGQQVEPGQRLGALDNSVLETQLRIAQIRAASDAAVRTAAAKANLARSRLAKIEKLAEGKSAGSDELERARLEVIMAEADHTQAVENRKAAEIEVEQIRAQIARRTFISPVRGVVDRIYADVGESLEARSAPVMKIVQTDALNIILHLPPDDAAGFKPGGKVRVVQRDGEAQGGGVVRHVSPVVDAASGTVRVKVEVANPAGAFRGGVRFSVAPGAD